MGDAFHFYGISTGAIRVYDVDNDNDMLPNGVRCRIDEQFSSMFHPSRTSPVAVR